jgi:hypothetical protein
VHILRQRVLQDVLQNLIFDMDDMHKPYPKIKEVVEFAKGVIVKKVLEFFAKSGNLITFSCVSTFERISS